MKTSNCFVMLAALVIGVGCQSNPNRTSNRSPEPEQAAQPTYTIEDIPSSRLSPTSREGDKSSAVYSSNIIAVYVNQPGKTNGGVTNGSGGYYQGTKEAESR